MCSGAPKTHLARVATSSPSGSSAWKPLLGPHPNADVIYSMSYLDLKETGPLVIHAPANVIAEIQFAEWTSGGVLRHAEFVSLREA